MLTGVRKAEEIVPYFIVQYVPSGWAGLVIVGALAAAMSTLSASINTASMVWVRDIYKPYIAKSKTDKDYLRVGFLVAGIVSVLMMAGAYLFYIADAKSERTGNEEKSLFFCAVLCIIRRLIFQGENHVRRI